MFRNKYAQTWSIWMILTSIYTFFTIKNPKWGLLNLSSGFVTLLQYRATMYNSQAWTYLGLGPLYWRLLSLLIFWGAYCPLYAGSCWGLPNQDNHGFNRTLSPAHYFYHLPIRPLYGECCAELDIKQQHILTWLNLTRLTWWPVPVCDWSCRTLKHCPPRLHQQWIDVNIS